MEKTPARGPLTCARCGLISPASALRCQCGRAFTAKSTGVDATATSGAVGGARAVDFISLAVVGGAAHVVARAQGWGFALQFGMTLVGLVLVRGAIYLIQKKR